jgi:hypothetical protein
MEIDRVPLKLSRFEASDYRSPLNPERRENFQLVVYGVEHTEQRVL